MAVKIRLTRIGAKKKPSYRLVAANSEAPRDGKFLEILGYYDPMKDPPTVQLRKDKVESWLEKGAIVSESAKAILKKEGLLKVPSNAK
jgi:small subunit ribosomal protein S16